MSNQKEKIKTMPLNKTTEELLIRKLEDGLSLGNIPISYKTDLVIDAALKASGKNIKYVRNSDLTYDRCFLASESYPEALFFTPYEFVDFKLALQVFRDYKPERESHINLQDLIPPKLLSRINLALKKESLEAFKQQPNDEKTYQQCLAIIKDCPKEPFLIHHIPEKHKTFELCMEAVMNQPIALINVPEKHKDLAMCSMAYENIISTKQLLGHIPPEIFSQVEKGVEANNSEADEEEKKLSLVH